MRSPERTIDISIVVPAFNAGATIGRAVESVVSQTYPQGAMELIVVDDCSDDSTADIVSRFGREHPGLIRLARTPCQSGSPAEPRNRGLSMARGRYVFFLDADDWLGPEAVERMLCCADEWGSDILLVKLAGEGGRPVPESMFQKSSPRVDPWRSNICWTFGPYKLFRRELVAGLEFPRSMPEDIGFVLRAYSRAATISVAADYPYYHLSYVQGGNISLSTWDDVESNLAAYEDFFGFIERDVPPRCRDRVLVRRLFRRDICKTLQTIAVEPDEARAYGHLLRLARIVRPLYGEAAATSLPVGERVLLEAGFEAIGDAAEHAWSSMQKVVVERIGLAGGRMKVEGRLSAQDAGNVRVIARDLAGAHVAEVSCEKARLHNGRGSDGSEDEWRFELAIPPESFALEVGIDGCRMRAVLSGGKFCPLAFSVFGYVELGGRQLYVSRSRRDAVLVRRATSSWGRARERAFRAAASLKSPAAREVAAIRAEALSRRAERGGPRIWLISDRVMHAGDNGQALFEYLQRNPVEGVDARFVISADSPDYRRMTSIGPVVAYGSREHKVLHLCAEAVISSSADESLTDLFGSQRYLVRGLERYETVFLQHGVIHNDLSGWLNSRDKDISLFITSAVRERESIVGNPAYGLDAGKVVLTGMPRHDKLLASAQGAHAGGGARRRKLLIAPTWRKWLVVEPGKGGEAAGNPLFGQSAYYRFFQELINCDELRIAAEAHGFEVTLLVHQVLAHEACKFTSDFCTVATTYDYRGELTGADVMLTDYSSVAFDFALLGRPVVYAQFDAERFETEHTNRPGYFSYADDGFGPVCTTLDQTVNALVELMGNPITAPMYRERAERFFFEPPAGQSRCSMVVASIESLLRQDGAGRQTLEGSREPEDSQTSGGARLARGQQAPESMRPLEGSRPSESLRQSERPRLAGNLQARTEGRPSRGAGVGDVSFALSRVRLSASQERGEIALDAVLHVRSGEPLALNDFEILVGERAGFATVSAAYPADQGRLAHRCRLRIALTREEALELPMYNPVRARVRRGGPTRAPGDARREAADSVSGQRATPDAPTADTLHKIKFHRHLSKYLALHGPYLRDSRSGLVAFFSQTFGKGTQFTVRHANVTDGAPYQAKLYAAWLCSKLPVGGRPLLLYEKNARHYEESARCVFERLVDGGCRDAWFVIARDVANGLRCVDGRYRDRFLIQHTFRHYLYFFRSRRFVGSEAMGHAIELRCQNIMVLRKLKSPRNRFVFLQHGVMYMVSLDSPERGGFKKGGLHCPTKVVVSSELEARHFTELAGFERGDLILSGLPKFDCAFRNPDADKIVVMPTWRPWEFVEARANPQGCGYARLVGRMVSAIPERLRDKVVVAPHPLFSGDVFAVAGDTPEGTAAGAEGEGLPALAPADASYDELLRDAALLVTDYSSIAYDAFYRGANVVFYWEDKDECMARYGGATHLMIDDDTAFGPTCRTPGELSEAVANLYGTPQPDEYRRRFGRIVEFHDGRNTERVVDALRELSLLGPEGGGGQLRYNSRS